MVALRTWKRINSWFLLLKCLTPAKTFSLEITISRQRLPQQLNCQLLLEEMELYRKQWGYCNDALWSAGWNRTSDCPELFPVWPGGCRDVRSSCEGGLQPTGNAMWILSSISLWCVHNQFWAQTDELFSLRHPPECCCVRCYRACSRALPGYCFDHECTCCVSTYIRLGSPLGF